MVSLIQLPSGAQQTSVLWGFLLTMKELLPQVHVLPFFKHTSPHKSVSLISSQACLTPLDEQISPIKVIRRRRTDNTRKFFISKLGISSWTIKPYQLQLRLHPVFPELSLFQSCTHTSWTCYPDQSH